MSSLEDRDFVSKSGIETENMEGNTPLMVAAKDGKLKIVNLLLRHDVDVNAVNEDENTALHLACAGGHRDVVAKLLTFGADRSIQNKDGNSALHLAIQNGDAGIVSLLLNGIYSAECYPKSWLGQQLIDRGLDVQAVQAVEEKFAEQCLPTAEDEFLELSLNRFEQPFLVGILGITVLGVHDMLLDIRATNTWLGKRLVAKGLTGDGLVICEKGVMGQNRCNTLRSFAHTSFDEISAVTSLQPFEMKCLREVHNEVIEEVHMLPQS